MERRTSDADLWTMVQGQHESLRNFIERYKTVLSKIEGLSDKSAIEALKKALWFESDFRKEISVNEPSTIQDALHRATGFAKNEEEVRILAQKHSKAKQNNNPAQATNSQVAKKHSNQGTGFVQHEGGFKGAHNFQIDTPGYGRGRGRGRGRGGRSNTWLRGQSSYDETSYCEHHRIFGHTTANCRGLGLKLAARLAAGTLKGDIDLKDFEIAEPVINEPEPAADVHPKRGRRNDEPDQGGPRQRINFIMGGSRHCADTVTAIKAYQRRADASTNFPAPSKFSNDVITFAEEETEGLDHPHNDPLVIQLIVDDRDVARILIDTGSSVDVIFRDTLQRMSIDLSRIRSSPKPITGFSGETTMTMGTISLPVRAGNQTKIVKFSVSDNPVADYTKEGKRKKIKTDREQLKEATQVL